MKLYKERPELTSQFDVSKLQKQPSSVIQVHLDQSANFGSLNLNVCVTVSSSLIVKSDTNATNRDKHINEASKQAFANNLFKLSCKYTQDMLFKWKICFNVFNIRT